MDPSPLSVWFINVMQPREHKEDWQMLGHKSPSVSRSHLPSPHENDTAVVEGRRKTRILQRRGIGQIKHNQDVVISLTSGPTRGLSSDPGRACCRCGQLVFDRRRTMVGAHRLTMPPARPGAPNFTKDAWCLRDPHAGLKVSNFSSLLSSSYFTSCTGSSAGEHMLWNAPIIPSDPAEIGMFSVIRLIYGVGWRIKWREPKSIGLAATDMQTQ